MFILKKVNYFLNKNAYFTLALPEVEINYHTELALIKQNFEQLLALSDPISASDWRPTDSQRLAYVQLTERVLGAIDRVRKTVKGWAPSGVRPVFDSFLHS